MNLLKGIGLHDCGNWQAKSGIHRAGQQEKKTGTLLGHKLKLLFTGMISFYSGKPCLCYFQMIKVGPFII